MPVPSETGINYNYGAEGTSVEYNLGRRPLGPFLEGVYTKLGELPSSAVVVELGSGAGRFPANAPSDRGWRVIGFDHDPHAVEQAQRHLLPGDEMRVGDITRLGEMLPMGVDAVVSHRVLHAIPPELHLPILQGVSDILKPGGEAFFSVASAADWKADALQARGEYRPGEVHDCAPVMFADYGVPRTDPFSMVFFTGDTMTALAERAGLHVSGLSTFTEPSGYDHLHEQGRNNTYLGVLLTKE